MSLVAHQASTSREREQRVHALQLHVVRASLDRTQNNEGVAQASSELKDGYAVDLSGVFESYSTLRRGTDAANRGAISVSRLSSRITA
jgi:L-rhamnose isomerase